MLVQVFLVKIIAILLGVLVIKTIGEKALEGITEKMLEAKKGVSEKRRVALKGIFLNLFRVLIWSIATLLILPELGINIQALVAGVGVTGLAIGFASKQVLSDYINGLFIIMGNQYDVGDEVEISGVRGEVVDINLRRTIIKEEKKVSFVPHSEVRITSKREG